MPWQEQSNRMWRALDRFVDSLNAIREVADLATQYVSELDQNLKPKVNFRASDLQRFKIDDLKTAVGSLQSYLRSLSNIDLPKEGEDLDKTEVDEIRQKVTEATEAFNSSVPESIDFSKIFSMLHREPVRKRTEILLASFLTTAIGDFEVLFFRGGRFLLQDAALTH